MTTSKARPVHFLFMDEKFADQSQQPGKRYTSLTGILTPSDVHGEIRDRYFRALEIATGLQYVPFDHTHASRLLPDHDDAIRFLFLENITRIICDLDLKIYRIGYLNNFAPTSVLKNEADALSTCFASLLFLIEKELLEKAIWPIMEMDFDSRAQDSNFAGLVRNIDQLSRMTSKRNLSLNNDNLGEVLYSRKRSYHGSIVDLVAYLLHARHLRDTGIETGHYKLRLASICDILNPAIAYDEVIGLQTTAPPPDYVSNGPLRYAVPIVPSDTPDI